MWEGGSLGHPGVQRRAFKVRKNRKALKVAMERAESKRGVRETDRTPTT